MHPDRVNVLSTLLFRYTPLEAFNDPFEGRPEIKGLASPDYTRAAFQRLLPSELERAYEGMKPEVRANATSTVSRARKRAHAREGR